MQNNSFTNCILFFYYSKHQPSQMHALTSTFKDSSAIDRMSICAFNNICLCASVYLVCGNGRMCMIIAIRICTCILCRYYMQHRKYASTKFNTSPDLWNTQWKSNSLVMADESWMLNISTIEASRCGKHYIHAYICTHICKHACIFMYLCACACVCDCVGR